MENQGFPTISIEKIMMKFLKKKVELLILKKVLLAPNIRRIMENNYETLLKMWREEKQKREKMEEELDKLKADLAREKEDRQYDDLVHKRELKELFEGKYEKE